MSDWRIYASHIGDYMKRWIFQTPWGTIRVHRILRSDEDRHFHDHPWDFTSWIFGRYTEITPAGTQDFGWFSVNRKKATALHRLVLGKPVWTFVVTGKKKRRWGFQTEHGWVYWRLYADYSAALSAGLNDAYLREFAKRSTP